LATAIKLKIGPKRKVQAVKATGPPAIHLQLDRSIFARTQPSQKQPDKASIQG
jgi:hypothetical protein